MRSILDRMIIAFDELIADLPARESGRDGGSWLARLQFTTGEAALRARRRLASA